MNHERKPQRQDDLASQLRDLIPIAEREGCYDAADWLKRAVAQADAEVAAMRDRASSVLPPNVHVVPMQILDPPEPIKRGPKA
jgi:hypothetical protein